MIGSNKGTRGRLLVSGIAKGSKQCGGFSPSWTVYKMCKPRKLVRNERMDHTSHKEAERKQNIVLLQNNRKLALEIYTALVSGCPVHRK